MQIGVRRCNRQDSDGKMSVINFKNQLVEIANPSTNIYIEKYLYGTCHTV